ncbi:MAG: hypothetical protein V7641_967 [Blastocatellia bacterium]
MKRQAMRKTLYVRLCLGVALAAILSACAHPPPEAPPVVAESQPVAPLPPAAAPPATPATMPAPTPAEVREAVARIYKDAVRLNTGRAPGFVVGDFNGDQSQDIAVVVEPVKEKLDDLNSDVAAWMIRDPLSASLPAPVMAVQRDQPQARPVINEGDIVLLAVIHGYGAQGWRDAEAQQTYLLKNAVGNTLSVQPRRAALAAIKAAPPPVRGDVIKLTMAGTTGFLYYDSSSYGWYDSRTYRGEVASRMAH